MHVHRTLRLPSHSRSTLLIAAVLLLGACASSGPPAPIVSRTQPGAVRPAEPPRATPAPAAAATAPVAAAPAATAPAAPQASTQPDPPSVQTAPVRGGAVESRGIESRPLEPRPTPSTQAPAAAQAPAVVAPPPAASPAAPAAAAPAPAAATPGSGVAAGATASPGAPNVRTEPRGTKLPYSDSTLADLRAAESAGAGAAAAGASAGAPAAAAAARPADTKPAEGRPAEPGTAEGEWSWPGSGRVMQTFAESSNKGIVLGGKLGDPVLAAADGRVIFSGNGPRGYGNLVIVKHPNELLSVYAHNRSLAVKEGENVRRGQKIAELGDSGASSPRLHFEIRQQGKPVDPARYLPRR